MFKPLGELFEKEQVHWQESDIRYFVQEYVRRCLRSPGVYCQSARGGVVTLRVASPALHQAVELLGYDLRRELSQVAAFTMTGLRVST